MADKILRGLGLRDRDLSGSDHDVVLGALILFARGGGIITWDLWRGCRPGTRAALIEAFESVRAEQAAAIGMATQGPKQAAQVLAAADGGDLTTELILDEFAEKLGR